MSSRLLLLVPFLVVASILPAGAQAASASAPASGGLAVDAPAIAARATAHVVSTPTGRRLALSIPVDYGLRAPVASVTDVRERMTLLVSLRLASGRAVRSTDRRAVAGASSWTIAHHVFFSVSQTRVILRSRRAGPVVLRATATVSADLGETHLTRAGLRVTTLPAPTPPTAAGSGDTGHARGADPCGYYHLADCTNASGSTWNATHFWADHTWTVSCPSGTLPHYGSVGVDVTMETISNRYSPTNFAGPNDSTIYVSVRDDNIHGHPYAYTPWLACTPNG